MTEKTWRVPSLMKRISIKHNQTSKREIREKHIGEGTF